MLISRLDGTVRFEMATIPVVLTLTSLMLSCSSATGDQVKLNEILFSGTYDFIDLTHPFDNDTVYWPSMRNFAFTQQTAATRQDGSWYATNDFSASEHGGTHIDAPYHFISDGQRVGDISLDKLIVPLIIADVSSKVNDNPNFVLYKSHLDYLLNNNLGKPCVIIFKFGWSKYFLDKNKYLGINLLNGTLSFPGLSVEVAEWITSSYKNIVGVGVDVASVDPGTSTDFGVHKTLFKAGLYSIENANLNTPIPEYGCTALVLPMKIRFGTGAPLRLVAICPKQYPIHLS